MKKKKPFEYMLGIVILWITLPWLFKHFSHTAARDLFFSHLLLACQTKRSRRLSEKTPQGMSLVSHFLVNTRWTFHLELNIIFKFVDASTALKTSVEMPPIPESMTPTCEMK
jgi:hypothetical protein